MNVEQLDRLLGATTWEQFEYTYYGSLELYFGGRLTYPVTFTLQTGLYFGKPVQAITALGQFVRMRDVSDKYNTEDYILEEINPEGPKILKPQKRYEYTTRIPWALPYTMINHTLYGTMI